jgi:hypothetical protein
MRARVFGILYLAAVFIAMLSWLWMFFEGFAWAIT